MSEPSVITNLQDNVLTITLNRPKANAFDLEMIEAVKKAFKQASRDASVRCVLLTARGKIFSAGQDLMELNQEEPVNLRYHLLRTYNPLVMQIRRLEKPVLAGVNGAVAGAAFGIVLACDLRIASEKALFIFGFTGIGLGPDSAISLLLPQLIGLGRATEAAFLNQPIDAKKALAWGLVNRLVPPDELDSQALEWAKEFARGPVSAQGLTKRVLNKAILPNLSAILDYEAHIQEIAVKGSEHGEGLRAFFEKRTPDFVGAEEEPERE
jgi:2-(1,2-epoxy-1,2-dihydrophenyl)acetyl-CoA isomerase